MFPKKLAKIAWKQTINAMISENLTWQLGEMIDQIHIAIDIAFTKYLEATHYRVGNLNFVQFFSKSKFCENFNS